MSEERFVFTSGAKKKLIYLALAGVGLTVLGIILLNVMSHGHGDDGHGEHGGHAFHWIQRVYVNLWLNNVYFVGIGIIGVFFLAFNYAAQAGWSAYIKRIPESFGYWLPFAGILTLVLYFVTNYSAPGHFHIFHWLDHSLYEEGTETYDSIIAGKKGYLNQTFFLIRMFAYFILWFGMWKLIRNQSIKEDLEGGTDKYWKMRSLSAIFIVIFAVTSSTSAWDWVLSIDTHWFSTMFGWYNFASWFVAGLSAITLILVVLHDLGYFPELNSNHLHDLGKFIFGFSIFWTYIWFSQFMLIYYANIPEETVYFIERMTSGVYGPFFYVNIIINFIFPFLFLMTRDAKRHKIFLKIVCVVLLAGHWLDFWLMVTPGTLKENGGIGFIEIGISMVFISGFLAVVLSGLSKTALIARNHPMMEESLHHHV